MTPETAKREAPLQSSRTRALLIESDRTQVRTLTQVLRTLHAEVDAHPNVPADFKAGSYDLVLADVDTLPEADRERVLDCTEPVEGKKPTRVLLFSSGKQRDTLTSLFQRRRLANLLARNEQIDLHDLQVTVQKILRADIFGIEKYFAWAIEPVVFTVTRSSQKDALIGFAEEFVTNLGVHPRLISHFCTVVDELMTNAVYNAPVDAAGRFRFSHYARTQPVELDPGEEVRFTFCCDGQRLGVSVSDPFGSLRAEDVQGYLAKCFRRSDDQVDQKAGGAGLGLYYVFEGLSHFVANIEPRKRTEIIGLIDLRGSFKAFAQRSKSLNIFVQP